MRTGTVATRRVSARPKMLAGTFPVGAGAISRRGGSEATPISVSVTLSAFGSGFRASASAYSRRAKGARKSQSGDDEGAGRRGVDVIEVCENPR